MSWIADAIRWVLDFFFPKKPDKLSQPVNTSAQDAAVNEQAANTAATNAVNNANNSNNSNDVFGANEYNKKDPK